MAKLDIIITHYREPWEVGKPNFDILALQRGIDFADIRVLLVNDGIENAFPEEYFEEYPYRVEQINIPHGGISAARNAGMDHATAEWINYCDFDDTYISIYAMRDIMNILPAPDYDVLWTQMVMQDYTEGKEVVRFAPERVTWVFTHAKYYRLAWLRENGIRFNTEMDFQEDSEFNAVVLALLEDHHRIGQIRTVCPVYAWCRREMSVTTRPGVEDQANWMHFLRNLHVCELYREKLGPERIRDMVVRTVYDTFLMINSTKGITTAMKDRIVDRFRSFMDEFDEYYGRPDDETIKQMEAVSKYELMSKPVPVSYEIVTAWKNIITGRLQKGA